MDAGVLRIDIAVVDGMDVTSKETETALSICKKLHQTVPGCRLFLLVSQDDKKGCKMAIGTVKTSAADDFVFYYNKIKYIWRGCICLKKGAGNCICRIAAWAMLCLIFLSLGGCARNSSQSAIICNKDENPSYSEIVSKILPSYKVTSEQGSRTAFSFLGAGNEVEAFDVQAVPALENGAAAYWYPHYLATVVIAVDRDRTNARINSWNDLMAVGEAIGYSDHYPDKHLLMGAIAYGLEGENFTLKKAANLLETLHAKKHLVLEAFDTPIMICYDYQVAALIKSGRNMEMVVPSEGTLTYQKGLLSNTKLFFTGDVESLLLSGGFRLLDGRCDDTFYPAAAYENADSVTDYDRLNSVFQDVPRVFRRNVQHIHLYTSADGREHQLFALVYMILVVIWTASVIRRAMQKGVRRAVLLTGAILLCWITVRLIKYQTIATTTFNRYLWFGYYIFQLTLPVVLLWLAWVIDRPSAQLKSTKWLRAMAVVNGLLIALVFTNDLHNWVFQIDLTMPNWASEYGYGIAFYFVTAAWVIQLIAGIVMLVIKTRKTPRKRGFVFTLIFCSLLFLYSFGYITRIPIAWESDYTMITGLFTLLFIEVCMRTGMVPVNTKYARLFTHSSLNMQIVDNAGTASLSSATATQIDPKLLRCALASDPLPIEQDENTVLFAIGIIGGYALWQEDISNLNRLHMEIAESVQKLTTANAILNEEEKVRRVHYEETAKIQLMTQLENEIVQHTARLSAMIEQLDNANNQPKKTTRIVLLLCYVKRRCNLFFREQETKALPVDELTVYIDELAGMADYSGVQILVTSEIKNLISIRQATLFYDFFYAVADWAAERECPTMLVHLGPEKEGVTMRLLPSEDARSFKMEGNLDAAITSAGGIFSVKDLDGAIGISLVFPKGGAVYD